MNKFLNRLDKIQLPAEFVPVVESLKPLLSSDKDLGKMYEVDAIKICFEGYGDSATMMIYDRFDLDCEYPLLVAGF